MLVMMASRSHNKRKDFIPHRFFELEGLSLEDIVTVNSVSNINIKHLFQVNQATQMIENQLKFWEEKIDCL